MARQRQWSRKPPTPAVSPATAPRFAFLDRQATAIALVAVLLAVIRIASTYPEMSITFDEPAHIACGMQYLHQHVYQYEPQHPPLARVMTAIGPYLSGVRPRKLPNLWQEG